MKSNISINRLIHSFLLITFILSVFICMATDRAISEDTHPKPTNKHGKDNTQEDFVELQNNMDLVDLVETISKINQETYILDESVKTQKVNIITPETGMKKEDFLKLFDVILNLNGLSVVKTGNINKVISSDLIKEESTPTIIDSD